MTACVDGSAATVGPLVAYRWYHGDKVLAPENFVSSRTSDPARRDDGSIQSTRPCHTLRSHCSCRVSGKEAAGWTATGRINKRVDVSTIVRSVASYAS